MFRRAILYFAILLFGQVSVFSQEIVTGLISNPLLSDKNEVPKVSKSMMADTLSLPFFDDFSKNSVMPDASRWEERDVFVNNTYSNRQITLGMATFDALDARGRLYETATSAGFLADRLTSKPIDMNYPVSSAVWFSFLYEAGGLSDAPEQNDSLALHFYAPDEDRWYSVWRATGNEERGFRNVILPVAHQRWLKKGFRFRFVNYASLSRNLIESSMIGNCDIWNVDYVLLDINRSSTDTVFNDVAFRLPVRSVLKRYEAMPWKQFRRIYLQEMGSSIPIHYRNNDQIVRNVTRNFEITDVYTNTVTHSFSAGATNVQPKSDVDYNANLIYTFNSTGTDSALFRIKCSLKTDEFDPKDNDTVVYYQAFRDYFAYDDGTSEGGYGINGLGSRNAMLACKFTSFIRDTLRGVAICFNDSYLDANRRAFDLMIWDDVDGSPGNVIYSREEVMVESGPLINGFYTYNIPEGVEVEGIFYVGWKQRSETFLNAGFDINTPHQSRQYFWLNGSWNQSQVAGSVMIRPVLGLPIITGIEDVIKKPVNNLKIWPNPASEQINIEIREHPFASNSYITIINLMGQELIRVPFTHVVDISRLKPGIYIISTIINGNITGHSRFIKTR